MLVGTVSSSDMSGVEDFCQVLVGTVSSSDMSGVEGFCQVLVGSATLSIVQSLEFVAETRILAEMKIENRGKNCFSAEKQIDKHTFFFFLQSVGVAESIEITP